MLIQTLRGDFKSQQESFNQRIEENDLYYRIRLIPGDDTMKEFVSRMEVYFSKKDFMLNKFIMDEQGNTTTTLFSNQKVNETLPADIFVW